MQPLLQQAARELQTIPVKSEVWDMVGMDLIGPFKKPTVAINTLRQLMTCYFSKWMKLFHFQTKLPLVWQESYTLVTVVMVLQIVSLQIKVENLSTW